MTSDNKELIKIEALKAVDVYRDGGIADILKQVRERAVIAEPDIETAKGRELIASAAYQVARTKTALDDMGKELVADLKKKSGAIDTMRKEIRDSLDILKDEIRKPLTDYENEQKARIDFFNKSIAAVRALASFSYYPVTAADIEKRLKDADMLSTHDYQEMQAQFNTARDVAVNSLSEALSKTIKEEEDRLELERHREAEVLRQQAQADAARKAAMDEQAAEIKKAAEVQAAQIIEEAKQQAEVIRATEPAQSASPAPVGRPNNAERDKMAKINNDIVRAVVTVAQNLSNEEAKAIVEAMARGKIPHVTINYGAK